MTQRSCRRSRLGVRVRRETPLLTLYGVHTPRVKQRGYFRDTIRYYTIVDPKVCHRGPKTSVSYVMVNGYGIVTCLNVAVNMGICGLFSLWKSRWKEITGLGIATLTVPSTEHRKVRPFEDAPSIVTERHHFF